MDLHHLRYFVAVAEELSFRRAAERLHLTRPPLTRQIMALEEEVGVRLLERGRRRAVSLTDAGHAFLAHAKGALQSVEAAGTHARRAARGTGGRLTVAGCALLAAPVLAVYLKEFHREFPEVEVSFTETTRAEELRAVREGRVHLAISANFGEELERCFASRVLATVPLFVVLPATHPLARRAGAHVDLTALGDEVLLCPPIESKPSYAECLGEICERTAFAPRGIRPVDGVENILGMVAAGYGVAILAQSTANLPMPGCRVKRLRLPLPAYRLRMLWLREAGLPVLHSFLAVADRVALPKEARTKRNGTPTTRGRRAESNQDSTHF